MNTLFKTNFVLKFFVYGVILILFWPILIMIYKSFLKDDQFAMVWYIDLWNDSNLTSAFIRSIFIGLLSSIVANFFGVLSAMAIHQYGFRFKKLLSLFLLLNLVLPELVFALSFLSWFFIIGFSLGLNTVLISHITFSISFSTLIISSRLVKLNPNLIEASKDLGASDFITFMKVILPLIRGSLFSSLLICFLLSMDDFLISFYVNGVGSETLPIKIYTSLRAGYSPKISALSSLLVFISFLILQLLNRFKPEKV